MYFIPIFANYNESSKSKTKPKYKYKTIVDPWYTSFSRYPYTPKIMAKLIQTGERKIKQKYETIPSLHSRSESKTRARSESSTWFISTVKPSKNEYGYTGKYWYKYISNQTHMSTSRASYKNNAHKTSTQKTRKQILERINNKLF